MDENVLPTSSSPISLYKISCPAEVPRQKRYYVIDWISNYKYVRRSVLIHFSSFSVSPFPG
jgi:hypothetical protein